MGLAIVAGTAHPALADGVVEALGCELVDRRIETFPDGEVGVEICESVRGDDVYVLQSTGPPVQRNLIELCLVADACRRAGAARLTAVVPYLAYARQDRRSKGRESVAARFVADLLETVGFERIVTVDAHSMALEAIYGICMEHLSASELLAEALRPKLPERPVVVAPDLGATKRAEKLSQLLDAPVAVVQKHRTNGLKVVVEEVIGEVKGRRPVIIDDMISTGGTIVEAARATIAAGAIPEVSVAAVHGLFVGPAAERLAEAHITRLFVTDSLPPVELPVPVERIGLASLLATTIDHLHGGVSLAGRLRHE